MARFKNIHHYNASKKGDTCFKSDEVISSKIGKYLAQHYPHVNLKNNTKCSKIEGFQFFYSKTWIEYDNKTD